MISNIDLEVPEVKMQRFISRYINVPLLSTIIFVLSATAALADGSSINPRAISVDGWGIDFNWGYIRPNGEVDVAVHARNFTGQQLDKVKVSFEVNGTMVNKGPFSLGKQKFIKKQFNADPLPPIGQDVFVSVTMCIDDHCAQPTIRKLNDERESNDGAPLSTRIRYRLCEIQLMVVQDPDFVLSTNGKVIAEGHLDEREWSQWFDLSAFATYPPSSLDLKLEATWDDHAPATEYFTIPADYMACKEPTGSVEAIKVDQDGRPWAGIKVILYKDGLRFSEGNTPVTFDNLELGHYRIEEIVPAGSEPLGPTSFDFTLDQEHLHFVALFQNRRHEEISCDNVELSPSSGNEIRAGGQNIEVKVHEIGSAQDSNAQYKIVNMGTDAVVAGPTTENALSFHGYPEVNYEAQRSDEGSDWKNFCSFNYKPPEQPAVCTLTNGQDLHGNTWINLGAVDENGNEVGIDQFKAKSNFSYHYPPTSAANLPVPVRWPGADNGEWYIEFKVSTDNGQSWLGGNSCRLNYKRELHTTGQYQDFIGPVAFGTYTPYLEPGKEYFDMTRSIMVNVEYLSGDQGDVVYRFNGQEIDGIEFSLFNSDTFRQISSEGGRAITSFEAGVTKLIAYRYGQERARLFQSFDQQLGVRWIHPLDQPFEHKYDFELELHGPAGATDLLVYGDEQRQVHYDQNGLALVELTYSQPGLIAIYPTVEDGWVSVASATFPITTSQSVNYSFAETGLYHYRLLDQNGTVVAGPQASASINFVAQPDRSYQAQLIYPATSLFVGLYDDMKFQHPAFWTMPIDGRFEHDHEFHLDYHRLNDPDLGNDHIRGDVVIDALYLTNGTTSVAQQFPYGRHDGSLPGVTIVGIPEVSMVAFCQRPGVHEVVYWGGWENESYYLPERGWIFDQELYDRWTEDQRGDCIDAAQRVNMALAREGLRTDHTYRHHGERSQGYQMTQHNVWSAYNLAGMRPPHIGRFLKPGTVLPYYEEAEDMLFWGWDLEEGGLADGIGTAELQQHLDSLGPVVYGDQTGIHPPEALNY